MKILFLASAFMITSLSSFAKPPENMAPDPALSQWFESLKQPNTNFLCCSIADCRNTELRQSPTNAGQWQALISKTAFGSSAPDEWLDIPNDRIIQHKNNPTGQVVICWYMNQIFCAVLPTLF